MLAPNSSFHLPSWPALNTPSQDARDMWHMQGVVLPPSRRALDSGANQCPAHPSPSLLTSCPLGTSGHSCGLCHQSLRGRALAAKVHWPRCAPPIGNCPPRGWAAPLIYANLPVQALLHLFPSVPRLALPLPPACTLCCGCPWAVGWVPTVGGGGRLRAHSAGPCPSSLAWTLLSLYLCILCNET